MARCRSITLVLEKGPWREFRKSWRISSAGRLRRCSHRARSSPIRNPADTPKTRPGRAHACSSGRTADAVFGGRPEAFSGVCLFGVLSQFPNRFLVLRGLPALVGYHAFRRWTPCGQPGAASRFFCGGKLRLALLAGHLNLSTPSHSERSGPNFSSRKSCIYDFRSGREVEESLLGLAKRLAPAEELNFNFVCVAGALLSAAPALASG
jgi:hypothetical protein